MTPNTEQIKKALECCAAAHSSYCRHCPIDIKKQESCECGTFLAGQALALINSQEQRIKELEAKNRQYDYEQRKLVESRDTYKEYAEKMQLFVEKIVHFEDKGYEPSAARYAAEMDMWQCVALEKKRLTEENEMLRAENENKCKDCAGCLQWKCDCANIEAQAKSDTVRKMLQRIKEDAASVSLLSNPPKFMLEIREDALDKIAKEMLESDDG